MTEALLQEIRTLKGVFESARDPEGRAFAPLADAYRRAGEVQQAVRLLNEGLARHPDFVPGHVVAARLYVEQGLAEEGAIAARNALKLDGENVSALRSLLQVLEEKVDPEADEVRAQLLALEPEYTPEEPVEPALPRRSRGAAPTVVDEPETDETMARDAMEAADSEASTKEEEAPPPLPEPPAMEAIDLDSVGFDVESLSRGIGGAYVLDEPDTSAPEEVEPTLAAGFGPSGEEPVIDLESLAPVDDSVEEEAEEPVTLSDLAPDAEAMESIEEPVIDLDSLAPVGDEMEEEVVPLAELAPEPEMELPTEEPVIDLADLAPEPEEPVMDLADLAPEPEEPVMDLADLAPEPEEPVMDLADLAPEPEEPVMDLADLAPEPEEEVVVSLDDLAPDEGEPVEELTELAAEEEPDEGGADFELEEPAPVEPTGSDEITMLDLAEMTAEENVVIDMDELGPGVTSEAEEASEDEASDEPAEEEAPRASEDDEDVGEPVYTRTLAELYVKQGAYDEALAVYRHLAQLRPSDADIARRIEELESGAVGEEDASETETLARELAAGGEGEHDVESPFAWTEEGKEESTEAGPSIKDYFEGLLTWKRGEHS